MADTTEKTQSRRIRILPEQWQRIEKAASGTNQNPNELLVHLAMEALDQRELFGKEARVHVARASLFAAQVLARGLLAEGREHEIEEIREYISTIVPDPTPQHPPSDQLPKQPDSPKMTRSSEPTCE